MCLVWKIVGFDKHSKPCPKHLGSFERQNCAIFLALLGGGGRFPGDYLVPTQL